MYKLKQNLKTSQRYGKLLPLEPINTPIIDFYTESDVSIWDNDKDCKIAVLFAINPKLVEDFISACCWYDYYFVLYPNNSVYYAIFSTFNMKKLHANPKYLPIAYDSLNTAKDSLLSNLEKQKFLQRGCSLIVLEKWVNYGQEFDNYMTSLEYLIKHENMNMNTNHFFNDKILKNQYMNMFKCFNTPTVANLVGTVTTPIVCIGAGTSLEKNIGYLKEIQHEVFVICCVNALNIVDLHGVKPDLVTTLDMMESMVDCCKRKYDIPIVQECSAQDLTPYFTKAYISLSGINKKPHMLEFLRQSGIDTSSTQILTSFSVAFYNIFLAMYLGSRQIILLGQDLAFDGDKTHADGYVYDMKVEQNDRIEVDGYYGGKVQTDYTFNLYREFLEHRIQTINAHIVNATEGGSYIKGSEHISLKEAYEKYIKGTEKPILRHDAFKSDFNVKLTLDMLIDTENATKKHIGFLDDIIKEDARRKSDNRKLMFLTDSVNAFKNQLVSNKFLFGIISENPYTLFSYYEYLKERSDSVSSGQYALRVFFLSALQTVSIARKGIELC